jgi:hypothetical protein
VAPNFFLTAKHLGGSVGDAFVLNSVSYQSVAFHDIPNSDLRVIQVATALPNHALFYRRSNTEALYQPASLVGRGYYTLGAVVDEVAGSGTNGWVWGGSPGKSQGMTTVDDYATVNGYPALAFDFQNAAGESMYSVGDSGGGMFIGDPENPGQWLLAGINYAVGPATTYYRKVGSSYIAISPGSAIHTGTGLYYLNGSSYLPAPRQSGYASEVFPFQDTIDQIIMMPGDTYPFDARVNFGDLNVVLSNYTHSGEPGTFPGDTFPFDGTVNFSDLNNVLSNYGKSFSSSASSAALTASLSNSVPEPSTMGLLALSGLILRRRRTADSH